MPNIAILNQETIDKIAAGEVVERPCSVVKELVENAIDAGSTAITVEIKEGGISFIRITDNGCGIERDQVAVAFYRHSTSKIRSAEDLLTVKSLGFRGEALSSISAVARVELITKTYDELTGTRYVIEGSKELSNEEIGAPDGTTFIVKDLFYNVPARRKFLKTAQTEGSYISDMVEKLALSHPDISFKFINNNQTKLHTSGNGNRKDIIYHIFGREISSSLLEVKHECEYFKVEGFIGKPVITRGNRNYENYFINGRYVKSNILSRAIEEAYKSFLMQHQYPFTVLYFTFFSELDVNVHPTKMELRFSEGERVYKELYQAVHEAIMRRDVIPQVKLDEPVKRHTTVTDVDISREKVKETAESDEKAVKIPPVKENKLPEPFEVNRIKNTQQHVYAPAPAGGAILREHRTEYEYNRPPLVPNTGKDSGTAQKEPTVETEIITHEPAPAEAPKQLSFFDEDKKLLDEKNLADHKIIGQLFDTYWLIEFNDKLFIMDQHAAHEKVLYERFMRRAMDGKQASQQLMPPQIITLTLAAGQVLKENLDIITQMGFEIESFGGNEYAVRAVPVELYGASGKDMVMEIIDDLMENPGRVSGETIKSRIATMACKAAVKGNNRLQPAEVKELVRELLTLENPYNCPHGRPTMISMSKYELEKKFKRIV